MIILFCSQGVLLNFLVYFKIITDIFGADVGDAKLASMLQVREVLARSTVHSFIVRFSLLEFSHLH